MNLLSLWNLTLILAQFCFLGWLSTGVLEVIGPRLATSTMLLRLTDVYRRRRNHLSISTLLVPLN